MGSKINVSHERDLNFIEKFNLILRGHISKILQLQGINTAYDYFDDAVPNPRLNIIFPVINGAHAITVT